MALQDWAPAPGERIRLRHNWPARDLRRGDLGTVVAVAHRVFGESPQDAADRWRAGEAPLALEVGTISVRWDRFPHDVWPAVLAQLEPAIDTEAT